MPLGKQIKHYRVKLGWSMPDLEARSGVAVGTIDRAEKRDSRSMKTDYLVAIAKAFGLTVEQLEDESSDYPVKNGLVHSGSRKYAVYLSRLRQQGAGIPVFSWEELSQGRHMDFKAGGSDAKQRRHLPWFGDRRLSDQAFALRIEVDALRGLPAGADAIFNPGGQWKTGAIAIVRTAASGTVLRRMSQDGEKKVLIAHDDAPWSKETFDPETDEILGVKVGVMMIDDD